eukprot:4752637-Pleurochrysis_carterae.AAC.2
MKSAPNRQPRTQAPEGAEKRRAARACEHTPSALMYRRVKAPVRDLLMQQRGMTPQRGLRLQHSGEQGAAMRPLYSAGREKQRERDRVR